MIRAILTSGSMRSLRHKPDRSCATKPGHTACHRQEAARALAAVRRRGSVMRPAASAGISNPTSARVPPAFCLARSRASPKAAMIKSELIEKLAEQNPHLYQKDVEDIVNAILDTVADALAQGDRVEL